LTAVPAPRGEEAVGCVLTREVAVLVVLTDVGPVRASYGARMLGQVARDRSCVPEPGEWVVLRRWYDGPVTVESALTRRPSRIASVVPLRRPRSTRPQP
jgi:ribosome biogenesis GTPase